VVWLGACSFEVNEISNDDKYCNFWAQSAADDFDWTNTNQTTLTGETGPPTGHGPGNTYILHLHKIPTYSCD